jgi:hypothetical protein
LFSQSLTTIAVAQILFFILGFHFGGPLEEH